MLLDIAVAFRMVARRDGNLRSAEFRKHRSGSAPSGEEMPSRFPASERHENKKNKLGAVRARGDPGRTPQRALGMPRWLAQPAIGSSGQSTNADRPTGQSRVSATADRQKCSSQFLHRHRATASSAQRSANLLSPDAAP